MTLRVLLVSNVYHPFEVGGAERSVRVLAEGLVEADHQVVVLTTRPRRRPAPREVDGVRLEHLTEPSLDWPYDDGSPRYRWFLRHALESWNPYVAVAVARLLATFPAEIVHTHNLAGLSTAVWSGASRQHVPVAHTLRDYYLLCGRGTRFRNSQVCQTPCTSCRGATTTRRRSTAKIQGVVSISQHLVDAHRRWGVFDSEIPTQVIPTPYPPAVAPASAAPRRGPDQACVVGFLGRLEAEKGVDLLVSTAADVPEVEFRIAGRGEAAYEDHLRSTATPNVTFVGHVAADTFLLELDALVVPSRWEEPLGRVVLEAQAAGTPVIASAVGGIPELIDDGVDGLLFPPGDTRALVRHIRRLTESGPARRAIRTNTKATSVDVDRTVRHHVHRHEQFYRDLVRSSKTGR